MAGNGKCVVLAERDLRHTLPSKGTEYRYKPEPSILVAKTKTTSTANSTDIEVRDRVSSKDSAVEFREGNVTDVHRSTANKSGDPTRLTILGPVRSARVLRREIVLIERLDKLLRPVKIKFLGKLSIALVPNT